VVAVVVGVQNEAHGAGVDLLERGANLIDERGVLIVHDEQAVPAGRDADVAAHAFEHVNIALDLRRLDLHGGEVALLRARVERESREQCEECYGEGGALHKSFLVRVVSGCCLRSDAAQ
jgi:hypothetical protein